MDLTPFLERTPIVEGVKRRTQLILQSAKPEWLFVISKKMPTGAAWVSFQQPPDRKALLLFTTAFAANDYIRFSRLDAQPAAMRVEDIEKNEPNWAAGGFNAFALNRCPRCNVVTTAGIQTLADPKGLLTFWAASIAVQRWRAERLVRSAIANLAKPEARKVLEFLRDHVDCANPYVHQVIAIKARTENDEAAA
jgi:hypothetical protein